ncbi:ABC transporter permease [Nocardioides kongjuensis]|uniref:Peptide/nickel transport system permease protein n=1 Tax=Nocardioides kongjuensis TaxID=349522 RepID=A0A852S1S2_9ACTN|nr:peptide/nickel transport system permease protein [Nocardioides kongjuensis]
MTTTTTVAAAARSARRRPSGLGKVLLRRLTHAAVVVAGVVCLTFIIARQLPGDEAVTAAGARATPEQLAAARARLGLDDPLPVQLWHYLTGLVQGDLGTSLHTRQPVLEDLKRALPASLELVGSAMILAVLIGLPLGVTAARFAKRRTDLAVRTGSMLLVSVPVFWLALAMQLLLSTRLGWFPVAGEYDRSLDSTSPLTIYTNITAVDALITGNWPILFSTLHHLVLPALVVAAYPIGVVAQMTRAALIEESQQDHARMERALGFRPLEILLRFSLRPAIGPVLTLLALVFAYTLVNSVLVEAIFNWPGIGTYTADAIRSVDTPAIAGVTLVIALVYVLGNLAVDVAQIAIDPRTRKS